MDTINQCEIQSLIEYFSKTMYRAKYADDIAKGVMQKCIELAKLDYNVSILDNSSGDLCAHYPSKLIFMESENNPSGELIKNTIYEGIEPQRLRELITKARSARCRTRFPMPVIFYQGKYICRSATLSGGPEIYGRSGFDYFFAGDQSENNEEDDIEQPNNCNNWVLCDQVRKEDIKLLKALNVGTIVDFMVEKKKVKFGLNVTSSEKVDKENRYSQFTILSLPYPGCEFFREFRDQNYSAENLFYNWGQTHVDAEIIVPQDNITERVQVKWKDYKKWNLPSLTENYLILLLGYVFDSSSGVLVHCISGWDRTPLFISLLRICLWADGAIHKSLTPIQMLYFTIAYDWLLFGHDLQDRKNKGEDIFYFCFHFLKFVMGDEFSSQKCRAKVPSGGSGEVPCEGPELEGGELIIYSQGSNHSLNSSWSSISSKSQEINPSCQSDDLANMPGGIWIGEGGPASNHSQQSSSSSSASTVIEAGDRLKMSHTSPVSVPTKTSYRQRNESISSLNVGSDEGEHSECNRIVKVEQGQETTSSFKLSYESACSIMNQKSETQSQEQSEVHPFANDDFMELEGVNDIPISEPKITFLRPERSKSNTVSCVFKLAKEVSESLSQTFESVVQATKLPSPILISDSPEFLETESDIEFPELELATEATEFPLPELIIEPESEVEQTVLAEPETRPKLPESETGSDLPELQTVPELPELETLPELPELKTVPELPELKTVPEGPKLETKPELPELETIPELPELETVPELPESETEPSEHQEQQRALECDSRSWQYVSSTGSLRSTASGSTASSNSRSSGERQGDTAISDSVATLTDSPDSCFINQRKQSGDHSQCGSNCAMRRERLDQIRKLFSICYCQSIGHNLKDGSEGSGISNIFGNIAGKIMKS